MVGDAIGAIDDARALETILQAHLDARSLVSGQYQRINCPLHDARGGVAVVRCLGGVRQIRWDYQRHAGNHG